eukprot:2981310-Alexandrium_andersonii.AAC.1
MLETPRLRILVLCYAQRWFRENNAVFVFWVQLSIVRWRGGYQMLAGALWTTYFHVSGCSVIRRKRTTGQDRVAVGLRDARRVQGELAR